MIKRVDLTSEKPL